MDFKDYYAVLGVERSADEDSIRRAYRKLARRFHPDVSTEPEAEQKFREINEAYEVLKDPEKRSKYDRYGAQWRQAGEGTGQNGPKWREAQSGFGPGSSAGGFGEESGFSAFFDMLFGRSGRGGAQSWWAQEQGGQSVAAPGIDVEARLGMTLEEAARGGVRELSLRDPVAGAETTINVKIPAGVRNGQRIRLTGRGRPAVEGGSKGDLYLSVEVLLHSTLRPEGDDIHAVVSISPAQAALGAAVAVPTLDGPVQLKVPAGSSSGRKIRLRGKGLPIAGGAAGDLYVEIRVVVPSVLSARERELYEELNRLSQDSAAVA